MCTGTAQWTDVQEGRGQNKKIGAVAAPSVAALVHAAESLRAKGFRVPPRDALLGGHPPPARARGDPLRGWQCGSFFSDLDSASRALLS